jgi:hypothetical protein
VDLIGRFTCTEGEGNRPHWLLSLHGPSTGNRYEVLPATRPNRHSLKVTVPLDLLEFVGTHMSMAARSTDATTAACAAEPCRDRAPDVGKLKVY